MPKFNQDKVNSIFLKMPDLRHIINQSFRRVTGICAYNIVRGTVNSTEAGYQPQGAEPRDYTDFEQVITGFDPIVTDGEDSVSFPFDGTLDQRHKQAPSIKTIDEFGITSFEKEKVDVIGSVFEYEEFEPETGTYKEFKLDRRYIEKPLLDKEKSPYKYGKEAKHNPAMLEEPGDEYQVRFKDELGKELDKLALPENKKKDQGGREYYQQLKTKYFIKKHGTGRYYAAYFLSDEVSPVVKAWLGNEHFQRLSVQKQITMLILNTKTKEIFKGYTADGFIGNREFFDRIDKYRLCLGRIPEFDLTYDLDNATENEEKKRKGFRGSFLAVDRTGFRIERTSYIRNPFNKEIIGAVLTFGSVNDLLSRSGVAINTKIQIGGPGEPAAEPTLFEVYRKNADGSEYINPRTGKKVLLGRVPVLDTQFTIPRPVTSATITFHGLCAFNSIAFYGRRAEQFNLARKGYEFVGQSGLIFPYEFHKTQWDPLTMKKPPETTYSVGSLHPMIQSYQEVSKMGKDIQNPSKYMPFEGIFNIPYTTFTASNEKALPFGDSNFLKDARWDLFLKNIFPDNEKPEDEPDDDPDNLGMTMANPYMKAVKHGEAAKKAVKEKKPVGIGPKSFSYNKVPKTRLDQYNREINNRNLATLNMLNWFTHNSYIEIPMSQHMAVYFDSRAEQSITDSISSVGQVLGGTRGLMGIGGVVGGAFGGPLGALFGGVAAKLGAKLLSPIAQSIFGLFGSIIGTGAGFSGNQSGGNSLTENQKRQLPGFMCLLPKDKLEIYIKTLFHVLSGTRHARLPYNYLSSADSYPDKLSAILGKSEISFTFTLSDNIRISRYLDETGGREDAKDARTTFIGQNFGPSSFVYLIDEEAAVLPGFVGREKGEKDPRVEFDGYGYIIEGFNVKCCGKCTYTLTFYSPQGYLEADEDGELKQGEKEYKSPYEKPSYAVWRGQYVSQALYADDTRLGNNTKNLAKPHHRGGLPFRGPRACLPVPPVDLKDPTKWTGEEKIRLKTIYGTINNHSSQYVGDMLYDENIKGLDYDFITEDRGVAYWLIPKRP